MKCTFSRKKRNVLVQMFIKSQLIGLYSNLMRLHAICITSANKDLTQAHGTMVDQISDLRKQV